MSVAKHFWHSRVSIQKSFAALKMTDGALLIRHLKPRPL